VRHSLDERRAPLVGFAEDVNLVDALDMLSGQHSRSVGAWDAQRRLAVKPERPTVGLTRDNEEAAALGGLVEAPQAVGLQLHAGWLVEARPARNISLADEQVIPSRIVVGHGHPAARQVGDAQRPEPVHRQAFSIGKTGNGHNVAVACAVVLRDHVYTYGFERRRGWR